MQSHDTGELYLNDMDILDLAHFSVGKERDMNIGDVPIKVFVQTDMSRIKRDRD